MRALLPPLPLDARLRTEPDEMVERLEATLFSKTPLLLRFWSDVERLGVEVWLGPARGLKNHISSGKMKNCAESALIYIPFHEILTPLERVRLNRHNETLEFETRIAVIASAPSDSKI